jgi:exonuclease SbcD
MTKNTIRVLHTSDWHLGAQLHEQERQEEHKKFLAWLKSLIVSETIDVLIIAGDIFDTYAPPVSAQSLYYDFLGALAGMGKSCPEIIIISGNHDSPLFLGASKDLLSRLKIHVVSPDPGADDEIFKIKNESTADSNSETALPPAGTGLLVCAVPFLRDRDLKVMADLSAQDDISGLYRDAASKRYHNVFSLAKKTAPGAPIVMTGHLFMDGSSLSDNYSERVREAGKLSSLPLGLLPEADYFALGHLHRPQAVGGKEHCRYSGSPLPMSFSEAGQVKSVVIAEFESGKAKPRIELKEIPQWQKLEQIKGNPVKIRERLEEIKTANENVWIDIVVNDFSGEIMGFWNELDAFTASSGKNALYKLLTRRYEIEKQGTETGEIETFTGISDLDPLAIFKRKLKDENVPDDETAKFIGMFNEIRAQAESEAAGQKE